MKSSDSNLSSTMIARKKQSNNPVQAMLNRFNKVRVESQTKDLEVQLSALTGDFYDFNDLNFIVLNSLSVGFRH